MVKIITSIFLIVIVLLGTIGVNYDTHFCGGNLVGEKLSFVRSDLSCGMSVNGLDINSSENSAEHFSQVCCENHHLGFQISDEYNDYQVDNFQFFPNSTIPEIVLEYCSFTQAQDYNFIGYSPPPRFENILLLKESFLI